MSSNVAVSVLLPTHNPHAGRLERTLAALLVQTLPPADWELLVIDNASSPPLSATALRLDRFGQARLVVEPNLGLTAARRRGLLESAGATCIFVDDDNILAPAYLAAAGAALAQDPELGAAGGKSLPEFEVTPPGWAHEFFPLLALRDLGEAPQIARAATAASAPRSYPACAPIGAGMVLRRAAVTPWLSAAGPNPLTDRRGDALSSAGDNDLVLSVLAAGWAVGYLPELRLTHLIPSGRLDAGYLARLNRGVQESWMQVLRRHDACPWPPLSGAGARLRQLRAWFTHAAWRGDVERIRWQGACGHFAGRID